MSMFYVLADYALNFIAILALALVVVVLIWCLGSVVRAITKLFRQDVDEYL